MEPFSIQAMRQHDSSVTLLSLSLSHTLWHSPLSTHSFVGRIGILRAVLHTHKKKKKKVRCSMRGRLFVLSPFYLAIYTDGSIPDMTGERGRESKGGGQDPSWQSALQLAPPLPECAWTTCQCAAVCSKSAIKPSPLFFLTMC